MREVDEKLSIKELGPNGCAICLSYLVPAVTLFVAHKFIIIATPLSGTITPPSKPSYCCNFFDDDCSSGGGGGGGTDSNAATICNPSGKFRSVLDKRRRLSVLDQVSIAI